METVTGHTFFTDCKILRHYIVQNTDSIAQLLYSCRMPTFAPVLTSAGFLLCAAAFVALGVALRPGRFGRGVPRLRLRLAALGTGLVALVAAWAVQSREVLGEHVLIGGLSVVALWVWQLEALARYQGQPSAFRALLRWAGPNCIGIVLLIQFWPRGHDSELYGRLLPAAGLGLATLGLIAVEQVLRNASDSARGAVRWLALGLGGLFVVQLGVFAQTLLMGAVPVEPLAVSGALLAACALAIWRGARRMPDWSLGLSISRHVVFYTTSLMFVGGYLLLMSVGGWLLIDSSSGWGRAVQMVFFALAGLMLALMLYSGALRQRLKVFISKHFYPQRYDYRLEWLRFIRTLSEADPATTLPQKAVRAVTQIIESPAGTLWRRNEAGTHFERTTRWPDDVAPDRAGIVSGEDALVQFLARTTWLIDLRELRARPALYEGLTVDTVSQGMPLDGLIVPLLHVDQLYGWLTLDRPAHLDELSFEDRDLLKTAGRQIAAHLAQYDADTSLAEARQFEAYNRMTAFVMHDLKNIAAQLKLISQNAERHKRNPEFVDDAMRTIGSSAARMTKLIAQLAGATQTGEVQSGTMQTLDLATVVERAAVRCGGQSPVPRVVVQQRPVVFADAERLAAVIEHSVRNAQDATTDDGEVRLEVDRIEGRPVLRIVDTGSGMDEAFVRDRLFRPFDTTKGTRGMGIGAFQIREYLRSLGGGVEVSSAPGRGTTFSLVFPSEAIEPMARRVG